MTGRAHPFLRLGPTREQFRLRNLSAAEVIRVPVLFGGTVLRAPQLGATTFSACLHTVGAWRLDAWRWRAKAIFWSDDEHWARRKSYDMLGNRAEQQPCGADAAMSSDNDQIRLQVRCQLRDFECCLGESHVRKDTFARQAASTRMLDATLERIDSLLHVPGKPLESCTHVDQCRQMVCGCVGGKVLDDMDDVQFSALGTTRDPECPRQREFSELRVVHSDD
jgi:hypothetical protein